MSNKQAQEREGKLYLIRSNLRGWWRPNSAGYTDDLSFAGVFGEDAARRICGGSLLGQSNESVCEMVPLADVVEQIRGDITEEQNRSKAKIERLNRLLSLHV